MNEDKSARYNRLRRYAAVASRVWSASLLIALVVSGSSAWLRDVSETIASALAPSAGARPIAVAVFVVLLTLLNEVGSLPIALYGSYALERQYGLSRQPFQPWLRDQVKALALGLLLGIPAACVLYALIGWFPERWWFPAAILAGLVVVAVARVGPLLLLPLFYAVKPLRNESLRKRLVRLGERAGAPVLDAYEWGLGEKTRKANASLTGIGASRRILVSDTMLAEYSDDEVEVVLAHELAHHVHGDLWTGLAVEVTLIGAGFFLASRLLDVVTPALALRGVDDVAGLPLLLLAGGAVSLLMLPATHGLSRMHERRADRFALQLTDNAPAFISAIRRLGAQNMAEEEPSRLVRWLFYSHPPIRERIAAAQSFKP